MPHVPPFRGSASRENELIREVNQLRLEVQRLWKRISQTPDAGPAGAGGEGGGVIGGIGQVGSGAGLKVITAIGCSGTGLVITYVTIRGDFVITN